MVTSRREAYDSGPLALCDWEIARAGQYQGPDGIGALMGQTDWMVEERLIREENEMLNRGSIWVSKITGVRVLVLVVGPKRIEYKQFHDLSVKREARAKFTGRFRPYKGKLI